MIKHGFRFSRSQERLPSYGSLNDTVTDILFGRTPREHILFPLIICFCDIPLSASAEHRSQYGDYVLGLSKQWGRNKSATPIRYVHKDSPDSRSGVFDEIAKWDNLYDKHGDLLQAFVKERNDAGIPMPSKEELEDLPKETQRLIGELSGFCTKLLFAAVNDFKLMKTENGAWRDRKSGVDGVRYFYDEREWRIVGRDTFGPVQFAPSDLQWIIVNTDEERAELLRQIRSDPTIEPQNESRWWAITKTWHEMPLEPAAHKEL